MYIDLKSVIESAVMFTAMCFGACVCGLAIWLLLFEEEE